MELLYNIILFLYIFRSLGGPVFYYYLSQHASHVGCAQCPGLKLVKSGESSRPRPGTPARAQAAHVCVVVLVCWYLFTYLQTGKNDIYI